MEDNVQYKILNQIKLEDWAWHKLIYYANQVGDNAYRFAGYLIELIVGDEELLKQITSINDSNHPYLNVRNTYHDFKRQHEMRRYIFRSAKLYSEIRTEANADALAKAIQDAGMSYTDVQSQLEVMVSHPYAETYLKLGESKTDECAKWLLNLFSKAPEYPSAWIEQEGKKLGFSRRIIQLGRERINEKEKGDIIRTKRKGSGWVTYNTEYDQVAADIEIYTPVINKAREELAEKGFKTVDKIPLPIEQDENIDLELIKKFFDE